VIKILKSILYASTMMSLPVYLALFEDNLSWLSILTSFLWGWFVTDVKRIIQELI